MYGKVCTQFIFIYNVTFTLLMIQDLVDDLKSELSGHFEDVMVSLMRPKRKFDAISLRKAMKVLSITSYQVYHSYLITSVYSITYVSSFVAMRY